MKKFFLSVYFNVILAVLAAVLAIMQEIWLGSTVPFINGFAMGGFAGIGFALVAEVVKLLFLGGRFSGKNAIVGSICGIIAALVTALIVL